MVFFVHPEQILQKWYLPRKFFGGNPFSNKVSVHMRTPKFFEAYASAYAKMSSPDQMLGRAEVKKVP